MKVTDDGYDRLMAAIARNTVQELFSISDTAWDALTTKLGRLSEATPPMFGLRADVTKAEDPNAQVDRVEAGLRTSARTIAAIFGDRRLAPEVAIQRIVRNPHMTVAQWRDVMRPGPKDESVERLRQVADHLRDGHSVRDTARVLDIAERQVERVSLVLGVKEWKKDREVAFATECVLSGLSKQDAYNEWCETAPWYMQPSWSTWRRRWAEAEQVAQAVA